MNTPSQSPCRSHGWLDSLAVGAAMVCAVHCLLTPILIVALPIFATTFFAQEDFHFFMIFLVLPMTGTAVFLGCRKHKDKAVLFLSLAGLSLLVFMAMKEAFFEKAGNEEAHGLFTEEVVVNLLGGLLISIAHFRNYRLCRKASCTHE